MTFCFHVLILWYTRFWMVESIARDNKTTKYVFSKKVFFSKKKIRRFTLHTLEKPHSRNPLYQNPLRSNFSQHFILPESTPPHCVFYPFAATPPVVSLWQPFCFIIRSLVPVLFVSRKRVSEPARRFSLTRKPPCSQCLHRGVPDVEP